LAELPEAIENKELSRTWGKKGEGAARGLHTKADVLPIL
jgi:hypothetical protein